MSTFIRIQGRLESRSFDADWVLITLDGLHYRLQGEVDAEWGDRDVEIEGELIEPEFGDSSDPCLEVMQITAYAASAP